MNKLDFFMIFTTILDQIDREDPMYPEGPGTIRVIRVRQNTG